MTRSSGGRSLTRAAAIGVIASAAIVFCAIPAFAHVTVTPSSVPAGATTVLTFHVPNEEAKANTVQVDLQIPTDHPIAQFLVKPVPGWTVTVKTVTLAKPLVTDDGSFSTAVSEVIWSGGTIAPGQFQDFSVSADPLPEGVSQLVFKAIQTYSNGDVVRWIDVPQAGQPAPDHPAAVLTLTSGQAATPAPAPATGTTTGSASGSSSGSSTLGLIAGIGGLIFGLAGLGLAGLMWRRRAPLTPAIAVKPEPPLPSVPPARKEPQPAARATTANGSSARKTSGSRRGSSRR